MQMLADEPVSLAKILDISIKLYVASFTKWIGFSGALGVVNLSFFGVAKQLSTPRSDSAEPVIWVSVFLIMVILCSCLSYAATIFRLDNVANQRQDSFMEALQLSIKKLPSLLFAGFIYMLAAVIGMLLLIVPGVMLVLSLAFYSYFIVLEANGAYAALKASWMLIKGHWWRTAAVFSVPTILVLAVYFITIMILTFIGKLSGLSDIMELLSNLLYTTIYLPFLLTVCYVQFHDLKLRKSGADLAARLAG